MKKFYVHKTVTLYMEIDAESEDDAEKICAETPEEEMELLDYAYSVGEITE